MLTSYKLSFVENHIGMTLWSSIPPHTLFSKEIASNLLDMTAELCGSIIDLIALELHSASAPKEGSLQLLF